MLTEEQKEQALQRAQDCGWAYTHEVTGDGSVEYRYTARGKASAHVSNNEVRITTAGGYVLARRSFYDEDLFMALAKGGRCADELAGTFRYIEECLSGL
jgi:hypothetical protein